MIQKESFLEFINLKHVFNGITHTLTNQNRCIRDAGMNLLASIFSRVDDSIDTIMKNLKALRPVLKKEIKEALKDLEKLPISEHNTIFAKSQAKSADIDDEAEDTIGQSKILQEDMKVVDISEDLPSKENADDNKLDLSSIVPLDFDKLPYVNQIMEKNKALKEFSYKLQDAIDMQKTMSNEDNYKVYNTLVLMLEDSNVLVYLEAIKIIELLSKLQDKNIIGKYSKKFVNVLFDKFKEPKTAVISSIRSSLNALLNNQIITIDTIVDILINIDSGTSVKTKKVIVSSSNKPNNPKIK